MGTGVSALGAHRCNSEYAVDEGRESNSLLVTYNLKTVFICIYGCGNPGNSFMHLWKQ